MHLKKKLEVLTKQMNASFTFKGRPMQAAEVFADTGLLPGLVKRADQLAQLCFGYGLGASFEDADDALLGAKVTFDQFTPDALRLFTIADVLYEIMRSSGMEHAVPLDELLYDD